MDRKVAGPQSVRDSFFQFAGEPLLPRESESHLAPLGDFRAGQFTKNLPGNSFSFSALEVILGRNCQRCFHQLRIEEGNSQLDRARHAEYVRISQQLIAHVELKLERCHFLEIVGQRFDILQRACGAALLSACRQRILRCRR